MQTAPALKADGPARVLGVKIPLPRPSCACRSTGRSGRLKTGSVEVRILARAPFRAVTPRRQRDRAQTSDRAGSTPARRTTIHPVVAHDGRGNSPRRCSGPVRRRPTGPFSPRSPRWQEALRSGRRQGEFDSRRGDHLGAVVVYGGRAVCRTVVPRAIQRSIR